MILDVARHKFSEGLLTLVVFAVAMALVAGLAYSGASIDASESCVPLRAAIYKFQTSHPVVSAIMLFPLFIYTILRMARSTVRVNMYSSSSLAVIALGAITTFAVALSNNYLFLIVVALLVAEVLGRILYCFDPNSRPHYLFTSMLALGAMPLIDSALIPLSAIFALAVILQRMSLRETIITIVGVSLPIFFYCYAIWLIGGSFSDAFMEIWNNLNISQHASLLAYLTFPRLIFLGVVLFFQLCSIIIYFNTRVSLPDTARVIWPILMIVLILLLALLLLLPSASPAIVVAMVLIMTVMLPQLFLKCDIITATIAYLVLAVSAVISVF